MGHVCRAVSEVFPSLLKGLPDNPVILDNACGTGAVTETIVDAFPTSRIYATDAVPSMVSAAKAVFDSKPELSRAVVEVSVMDGEDLRFQDDFFDAGIMNFGIFFFPNPQKGVIEAYRTLKPGGTAIFTLWKYFGFKPILWEIQKRIQPADPLKELPLMEVWTDGTKLETILREVGFSVELIAVDEVMWGNDQEDFEKVLVENYDALVARNWTAEERAKLAPMISQVLRDLSPQFTIHIDGKIGVKMIAWVAVCKK